jgi:predicted secreted hydrolase
MHCAMSDRSAVFITLSLLILSGCTRSPTNDAAATGIRLLAQTPDAQSFQRAENPREFVFPRDHGVHDDFATEWWYFTGNLESPSERRFGFELTFFRYALSRAAVERPSKWGSNQVWLAHFALTDVLNNRFLAAQRMGRGALGIAGADVDRLDVHVRDWSARSKADTSIIELEANSADASISLRLTQAAPVALHGDRGLDRKGMEPGNASYYYSIPRMNVTGSVQLESDEPIEIAGTAWLDREWATSSLDAGVEGWDWFGLQLDDDTNLMLYRLRNTDETMNTFSTGTLMSRDGSTVQLDPDAVRYEILRRWSSPASGVTYPVEWRVSIPDQALELRVVALIENQEFNLGLRYWEGAVEVSGISGNDDVSGVGYLELAGYR